MRINHNIAALNTYRQLGAANNAQSSSMEKLSSGLRINKAGDDAAGLAISEKMRGQIRGLDMASKNAQDGISLIQTAEGALNETHSILQRMRELAVQSANDTNTDTDRAELQKEVDQLAEELTRIAENTEFNTQNLLGENGFSGKFHIGANAGQDISLDINDMGAKALGVNRITEGNDVNLYTDKITLNNLTDKEYTIKFTALGDKDAAAVAKTSAKVEDDVITITLAQEAGDSTNPGAVTATYGDIAKALSDTGIMKATVKDGEANNKPTDADTNATLSAGTIDTTKGIDISSQDKAGAAITNY
jgi:flagellin